MGQNQQEQVDAHTIHSVQTPLQAAVRTSPNSSAAEVAAMRLVLFVLKGGYYLLIYIWVSVRCARLRALSGAHGCGK